MDNKCLIIGTEHKYYRVFDAIRTNKLNYLVQVILILRTPNICDRMGVSLLHYAVMTDRIIIVKELISLGANCNTLTFHQGRSPMYSAYFNNNKEMISILAKAGATCVADNTGYFPTENADDSVRESKRTGK